MRKLVGLVVVAGLLGIGCSNNTKTTGAKQPLDPTKVSVQLTSVTLGEDCGGTSGIPTPAPKAEAPAQPQEPAARAESMMKRPSVSGDSAERSGPRPCQQTSMQLSVKAPAGAPGAELRVKKVELFDEKGKRVAELSVRSSLVWTNGVYAAWDGKIAAGQSLSVSYPLSQPDWTEVTARFDQTYVLKIVVSIGEGDQSLEREVIEAGPARLPPGVVT